MLPSGFVRIRHYGFLANRVCREKLALCRALLGAATTPEPVAAELTAEPKEAVEGKPAAHVCPACGEGRMVIVETLQRSRSTRGEGRSRSRSSSGRDSIRPEPSAWGESDLMNRRGRDRPWR